MMSHLILYVDDQQRSTAFYATVLGIEPELNVPGMTEFRLSPTSILGLMPARGIERLLELPPGYAHPQPGWARAELYLMVDDPEAFHRRAIDAGAKELSELAMRDWGDEVAYCLDPDGYVLGVARRSSSDS